MSALAEMPIAVLMRRRSPASRWVDHFWSAEAVLPMAAIREPLPPDGDSYLVPGLRLTLHADENDGYYENWIAPAPKVFVMWRMQENADRAVPILASVSYVDGTRMFDSGESADGVPMPPEVHGWLGAYLRAYYRPREARRGRGHG